MKKQRITTEVKVGLTVILATAILIFGIIWGKGYRLHTNKYKLQLLFDNIGGMIPGDPVTVNGVKEGKVVDIQWKGHDVLVTIELNDRVRLYDDATFTIISAELLAGMKVEIFPGKSEHPLNLAKQPFRGKYGGRIVDVGLTIDRLAKDLSSLTFRLDTATTMLNKLLKQGTLQKDLTKIMSNLNNVSTKFEPIPDSLSTMLQEMNRSLRSVNRLIETSKKPLDKSFKDLQKISRSMDSLTTKLNATLGSIQKQQGTLGKMIYDPSLYNNLNKTLLEIDSLSKRLRKKGLKLSLF